MVEAFAEDCDAEIKFG